MKKTPKKPVYLYIKIGISLSLVILALITINSIYKDESASTMEEDKSKIETEDSIEEVSSQRELTEDDHKYIQLLENKEYPLVIKETEKLSFDNPIRDYYYLALALDKEKELKEFIEITSKDEFGYDHFIYLKSSYIVDKLEKVNYIPDVLKVQIEDIERRAAEKEKYYSAIIEDKQKQIETEIQQTRLKNEMENRTANPKPVTIGMTKEEVLTEGWGQPKDINRTTTVYGVSEQWVYPNYQYLYFEDGILVTIQN